MAASQEPLIPVPEVGSVNANAAVGTNTLHHNDKMENQNQSQTSTLPNGSDGTNGTRSKPSHNYDPAFTDKVIAATGPKASPRMRQVMTSLIRHLHDFARETDLTVSEWMAGVDMVNASGQMSTSSRNETQLLCDILGLESLVDEITFSQLTSSQLTSSQLISTHTTSPVGYQPANTASAILGPFWRANAPILPMNTSIVASLPASCSGDADHTYLYGRVLSSMTGQPIWNAELDIWHTAPNGLYEQQDEGQPDMNLRGRFVTGKDGRFGIYCLRPTSYPIPFDGPAGKLLKLLDRHPMRPAHIHFIVTAPKYKPLTTQIFDRRDKHIFDDAVFAVKDSLVVDFLPREGDEKAQFQLEYDFWLVEE